MSEFGFDDAVKRTIAEQHARIAALEAENAALRELVRDMNKWLWNGADCTECPFTAECNLNVAFESDRHAHICIGWREIHNRMRELGIEEDACPQRTSCAACCSTSTNGASDEA